MMVTKMKTTRRNLYIIEFMGSRQEAETWLHYAREIGAVACGPLHETDGSNLFWASAIAYKRERSLLTVDRKHTDAGRLFGKGWIDSKNQRYYSDYCYHVREDEE